MMEDSTPKASIKGIVYGETGKPAGGVKLLCNEQETTTLFDGSYTFENISPGNKEVKVNMEEYLENPISISVNEGEEISHDIYLEQAKGNSRIWGKVISEHSGKPPETGGTVFLKRHTVNKTTSINPLTGYYEFKDLTDGTYHIWPVVLEHEDNVIKVELDNETNLNITLKKKAEEVPWG